MRKVLIVDDSTVFRTLLKETLSSQLPSLTIYEAENGGEAMERMLTLHPDTIFMDVRLPDRNGLEVTRLIKEQYPDVSVVILSNYDLPEYREGGVPGYGRSLHFKRLLSVADRHTFLKESH